MVDICVWREASVGMDHVHNDKSKRIFVSIAMCRHISGKQHIICPITGNNEAELGETMMSQLICN